MGSSSVGRLDQIVAERARDLLRLVLVDPVLGDEAREEGESTRRATSWRAGMERKARVSSLKPTVL